MYRDIRVHTVAPTPLNHPRVVQRSVPSAAARRNLYWQAAQTALRRIWTLADRAPWRSTYGSFDREYWHYRTADFPCGMQQEAMLALAIAHTTPFPGNAWYRCRRVGALVHAALTYTVSAAGRNGALDDYFPWEQAVGATAFALRAAVAARELMGIRDPAVDRWMWKAAHWLLTHRETGDLANHHALVCLATASVGYSLDLPQLRQRARARLRELLDQQTPEGWFPEYGGCDPGYHTVLIAFLADLWKRTGWQELRTPLRRALDFAEKIQHPDGSFGGEYGSRNTFHCYAHGFERLAEEPPARRVLSRLARGLERGQVTPPNDDRMVAHYAVDRLLAARDARTSLSESESEGSGSVTEYFPRAGFLVFRDRSFWGIIGCSKGGVLKLYRGSVLTATDTGIVVRLRDGRVAGMCVGPPASVHLNGNRCVIVGQLHEMRHPLLSPFKQILFRVANLTVGRLSPNLLRWLVQKTAITGRSATGIRYKRTIEWGQQVRIEDKLELPDGEQIAQIWLSTDATAMYVAASEGYQAGSRFAWREVGDRCAIDQGGRRWVLRRRLIPCGLSA